MTDGICIPCINAAAAAQAQKLAKLATLAKANAVSKGSKWAYIIRDTSKPAGIGFRYATEPPTDGDGHELIETLYAG